MRISINTPDGERPAVPGLTLDDSFHRAAKRIAHEADAERAVPGRKCLVRPFDEFCEVEKESGFDLVLHRTVLR
jgi:hypothetical protein